MAERVINLSMDLDGMIAATVAIVKMHKAILNECRTQYETEARTAAVDILAAMFKPMMPGGG